MEDIYTIKVRTRPDPSNLYPSERRYSASTVLGLGVVHLALGLTAFLLATLTLVAKNDEINLEKKYNLEENLIESIPVHLTVHDLQDPETSRKIELFSRTNLFIKRENTDELHNETNTNDTNIENLPSNSTYFKNRTKISPCLTLAPCIMSLAAFLAGLTAILAWRRWYIDHNIVWFFITSVVSTIVSLVSLVAIVSGITNIAHLKFTSNYYTSNPNHFALRSENGIEVLRSVSHAENNQSTVNNNYEFYENKSENLRVMLALNIAIAAALEVVWSYLSAKIAWKGMKSTDVDDTNYRRGGNLYVNTVIKGNNIGKRKLNPKPDIIAHYPKKGKIAKYFPKTAPTGQDYLPKAESHKEYQERVNKFLTSDSSSINDKM